MRDTSRLEMSDTSRLEMSDSRWQRLLREEGLSLSNKTGIYLKKKKEKLSAVTHLTILTKENQSSMHLNLIH